MTIAELKERGLLLFECLSGSKAYGLATPTSDTDIKGVYYLPKAMFYGFNYIPQISNESNDEVYYELGRFMELLVKNNPNILEILASPPECVLYKHPIMEQLDLEMFLSKRCKETFGGYAVTQIKKAKGLNKKIVNPMPKTKKSILDFCFVTENYSSVKAKHWLAKRGLLQKRCGLSKIPNAKGLYALFYDEDGSLGYKGIANKPTSDDVSVSSIPPGAKELGYLLFNQDSYSTYCKQYNEYWDWVANRNEERYNLNQAHGKDYDAKNMMHTIRLLQVALEILRDGRLNVKRANRDELLGIKRGELNYQDLLNMAEELIQQIEHASITSQLQETPDAQKIENLLIHLREELYA